MANERQQSAGYGGSSKSGRSTSSGSRSSGPGKEAKGSPRTRHVGSLADYEKQRTLPRAFDYVPSAISKAVTGKFFASEPEFKQTRDIKDAYRGYRASPPHAGMTGRPKGMKAAAGPEAERAMQKAVRTAHLNPGLKRGTNIPYSKAQQRSFREQAEKEQRRQRVEERRQELTTPHREAQPPSRRSPGYGATEPSPIPGRPRGYEPRDKTSPRSRSSAGRIV